MLANNLLPPQNIEAEEAILGGILLDPDALGRIVDTLTIDAFYVSAHRTIYQAALSLHGQGQPTDLMTISTWLQDHHHLEEVGGIVKLTQLLDQTVSAANIDRCTGQVMEKYLRRQLISAGHEIVELGYDTTQNLDVVLDAAEQKIFGLTQKRPQAGLVAIAETLMQTYADLEKLHEKTASPGIETTFYDLDAMTGGLQRADLIILAGRPSMGKTALGLSMAANIAKKYQFPIAIFSLEMSKEQLALRLLASEARLEGNKLRTGHLSLMDVEKISVALGNLSGLPIYIDDTASITVMQIRSQVRRLQSERKENFGLVLIDYLQLMEGGSENRVQELSKITRSLKGLAREINAPVMALSQLSRGVESRNSKRPMMSDLRESGCLSGDTLIVMADSGKQVPIRELVGLSDFAVWSVNEKTMRMEKGIVTNAFSTGVKPVFTLTTGLGRKIKATSNHKFLTIDGWKRLDELSVGQHICDYLSSILGNTNRDIIPKDVWRKYVVPAMKEAGISARKLQSSLGMSYCGNTLYRSNLGRERALNVAKIVRSDELLALANGEVYWDQVRSIKYSGEEPVFDLTVHKFCNFVANNIVVHNSIEQDADLIMMIYRDEYYNADSPDRGIAEILITKHRNGPTGIVKMLFEPEFTQFLNLQADSYS